MSEKEERAQRTVAIKRMVGNCCVAVLLTYADRLGMSEAQLRKLGAPFGVGMGGFEATCGAVCGAQMVLGMTAPDGRPVIRDAKGLVEKFRAKAGAIRCRDLKGIDTGVMLCSCENCVKYAVESLEEQRQG